MDAPLLRLGRPANEGAEGLDVAAGRLVGVGLRLAHLVEFELGLDDLRDGTAKLSELLDLGVGKLGLRGTPAGEDVDVADAALTERIQGVGGDVGAVKLVWRLGEDARHIHGHIADADDDNRAAAQVEGAVGEVGVAVVPGDELGGGEGAVELLALHAELAVRLRTDGVEHTVVAAEQLIAAHIAAHGHIAEEAEARVGRRLLEGAGDALDLGMVWRNAEADEAEGCGQRVEEINGHGRGRLAEQRGGSEEAGGASADDGDTEGKGGSLRHRDATLRGSMRRSAD